MCIFRIEGDGRVLELAQRPKPASNFRSFIFARSYRPRIVYNVQIEIPTDLFAASRALKNGSCRLSFSPRSRSSPSGILIMGQYRARLSSDTMQENRNWIKVKR